MSLFEQLRLVSDLEPITLRHIFNFTRITNKLKDDILLAQPASHFGDEPPVVLPPSIVLFMSQALDLPGTVISRLWDVLRLEAWEHQMPDDAKIFEEYGHRLGLTIRTFYPPFHHCPNTNCERTSKGLALKKAESRQAVLYTFGEGPLPVYSVHLYCPSCQINHHHNFHVKDGQRHYYDYTKVLPDVIQVGEHQFVERRVAESWKLLMNVAWASATNCARIYNHALSGATAPVEWQFSLALHYEHVWDGVIILSLLQDCQRRTTLLTVPHTGAQSARFTNAMHARNHRIQLFGQDELRHYCLRCTRFFKDSATNFRQTSVVDSATNFRKTSVVVTDGLTLGFPCCASKIPCTNDLINNHDRFCEEHKELCGVCSVEGCDERVKPNSLVCHLPDHVAAWDAHKERGQSRHQLQERLQRSRVAHLNDALPHDQPIDTLLDDDNEAEITFNTSQDGRKKLRARFGRKRTHNEQILVAPCGVIIARETFYNAEGIGAVVEMIKRVYRDSKLMPEHIFYDNNCTLSKAVHDDPVFKDVALTVDGTAPDHHATAVPFLIIHNTLSNQDAVAIYTGMRA